MVVEPMFSEDSIHPIAVLIDELRNDDLQHKLSSMKRLSTISIALGPERTRDELIPFLTDNVYDDDEVLLVLAEQLGEFVPLIGGSDYAHCLLAPLKCLCQVEETMVREKAVASLCKLAEQLSDANLEKYFVAMVIELASASWFSARASSCGLIAPCYPRVASETQAELRRIVGRLCSDETPMVRRAIAAKLAEIAVLADMESIKTQFLPLFSVLVHDEQDSVRMLAVDVGITIASMLPNDEALNHVLQTLKTMYTDKSWRVRYVMAEKLPKLLECVQPNVVEQDLMPCYQYLLSDVEAEVRSVAASKVKDFVTSMPNEDKTSILIDSLVPHLRALAADCNQHVKVALASVVMKLAPVAGRENTIEHLLPIYLVQLKDECAEVRLNIISSLGAVNEVIGVQQLSQTLMPAIIDLAEDAKWRVRLAIIEFIPALANQLSAEFFDEKLHSLCMTWLTDSVFAIRNAATNNLASLTKTFGQDWVKNTVVPKIVELANDGNYLYRMTAVFCINVLAPVVDQDTFQHLMLPVLFNFANDSVPNLRFNFAQSLGKCKAFIPQNALEEVAKPLLEKLKQDADVDVRYFAEEAYRDIMQ